MTWRDDTPWWAEIRASLPQVAEELGIPATARTLARCPSCGAERRGREDRRHPVTLRGDRWRCWVCEASGRLLDLAGAVLGAAPASLEVRAWLASRGWAPEPQGAPVARVAPRPLPAPPPEPECPPRPPGLTDWWATLLPVDEDPDVAGYLRGRGIDPATVADRDLARAVPPGSTVPRWAWYGSSYRLVVPAWDAAGQLATVRLRRVHDGDGPKSVAPRGCDASGAVYACSLGRKLLETGALPVWWPADRRLAVVVCEGEIDWLALVAATGDTDPCTPAVLGLGSWSEDLGSRIPSVALVVLATDADSGGDTHAGRVARTLSGQEVRRWAAA